MRLSSIKWICADGPLTEVEQVKQTTYSQCGSTCTLDITLKVGDTRISRIQDIHSLAPGKVLRIWNSEQQNRQCNKGIQHGWKYRKRRIIAKSGERERERVREREREREQESERERERVISSYNDLLFSLLSRNGTGKVQERAEWQLTNSQ